VHHRTASWAASASPAGVEAAEDSRPQKVQLRYTLNLQYLQHIKLPHLDSK